MSFNEYEDHNIRVPRHSEEELKEDQEERESELSDSIKLCVG